MTDLRQQTRERLLNQNLLTSKSPVLSTGGRTNPPPLSAPGTTALSGSLTNSLWKSLTDAGYTGSLMDMNKDLSKILNKTEAVLSAASGSPALTNAIQGVVLGDTPAMIDEQKNAHIPVAGAFLGLVKSSSQINEINVSNQGIMSVNGLDIKKLIQYDEDTLILNSHDSK